MCEGPRAEHLPQAPHDVNPALMVLTPIGVRGGGQPPPQNSNWNSRVLILSIIQAKI